MARVTRTRTVEAPPSEVWKLVSDPYNLPRWWPRTARVENVDRKPGGKRTQWTKVLQTSEGRSVRADFRCVTSAEGERYAWEQDLAGTPFERHLKALRVEVRLRERDGGTEVSLTEEQSLKGMSKLGSPLMRRARAGVLDEALDGIEGALT
ncbi:MAG TPA: SRPBCC family protein [Solirubrobacterales bacterium]|nr:SRPBCC family protein [Solirubrobacterales bacterium]